MRLTFKHYENTFATQKMRKKKKKGWVYRATAECKESERNNYERL